MVLKWKNKMEMIQMDEKKTISLSAIIAILISLSFNIAPGMFDTPQYFCEDRPELGLQECDSFSKWGSCLMFQDSDVSG